MDSSKHLLTTETLAEFKNRFGVLHDAMVHTVTVYPYATKKENRRVKVEVVARDLSQSGYKWVNLEFNMLGLSHCHINQKKNYTISVILSMNIFISDENTYLDFFSGNSNLSDPEAYYESASEKGFPSLLIVGKTCYWTATPYQEPDSSS